MAFAVLDSTSALIAGLRDSLIWIFFAARFTSNRKRQRREQASGRWLTAALGQPKQGCCAHLACFSDAIGSSLESRGFVLILMTAEETAAHLCGPPDTWSRGRDAFVTAAVKTKGREGREGHEDHTNLSPFLRHTAFGLCRFASCRNPCDFPRNRDHNWFLISCVRTRRPHIVDWLYVARWGSLPSSEGRTWWEYRHKTALYPRVMKPGKFTLFAALIYICRFRPCRAIASAQRLTSSRKKTNEIERLLCFLSHTQGKKYTSGCFLNVSHSCADCRN